MVAVPKLLLVFVSFSFLLLVLIQPDLEFVLIMDKHLCRLPSPILWFQGILKIFEQGTLSLI